MSRWLRRATSAGCATCAEAFDKSEQAFLRSVQTAAQKRALRLILLALPLLWLVWDVPAPQAQQAPGGTAFDQTIQPFLAENCYGCHNARNASGGLNLTDFRSATALTEKREEWELVLLKLQTGEMPPKSAPRPDPAEVKTVVTWIEREFARADSLAKPDPGRVTARRLNRAEYNNTVRELLGVHLRPADDFPQDDSGYGFDNIGDVLSLSPVLMEKYLTAAEKVARTAIYGAEQLKPTLTELRGQGRRIVPSFTPLFDYDTTGLSLPNALHVTHRFPVEAEYTFRLFLNGARPAGSDAVKFALWVDGQQVQVRELDPEGRASFSENRQDFDAFTLDFRARVTAGEHWIAASVLNLYDGLPPSYNGPNPAKKPQPPPPVFKPRPDLPAEVNERRRKIFEERLKDKATANAVRVSRVDIGGPYNQPKGPTPESLKKLYVCGHHNGQHQATCGRKIVRELAHRAYRRPVTTAEVNQLIGLLALAQQKGDSFEEGLCLAVQALLISPHFLFRIEQDRPMSGGATASNSYQLSPHELASRLSYFLWSSMPDDELLRAADQGTLRQPAVLTAQVRRMLKDEKARALVENFGGQWLELRKLESVKPDRQKFPDFDEYLRMSVQRETELFFENIVREDRSILDFVDAKYSFLNERLAQHYKIPGVKGPEFRRVALDGHAERGGVLTQASILTISSYTTRTSPVLRGKWILENILNAPPPPPPPDVPTLDESKVGTAGSLRQQLEEHRKNPTCAACHDRLDPLGFGLEKFDAIGAWRTQDGKFPIDDMGTLPDGRTFRGPAELRTILLADRGRFAQGLTEKLLTYGLGRGLERYDKPVVKKIANAVAAQNYRFSSLVLEIVQSLPFQKRRGVAQS
jgi:mono/diheme cytochrome c family protein